MFRTHEEEVTLYRYRPQGASPASKLLDQFHPKFEVLIRVRVLSDGVSDGSDGWPRTCMYMCCR